MRVSMPKFAMYSRVEKDLLQCLLVRATEFSDGDVEGLRVRFFSNTSTPSTPVTPIDEGELETVNEMMEEAIGGERGEWRMFKIYMNQLFVYKLNL